MDLNKELQEFLNQDQLSPATVQKNTVDAITKDLKWFPFYVFSKILVIHFVIGFLTLLFCPQFGIGPLGGEFGITKTLMQYGHLICASVCGGIFLGSSSLAISLILKRGEWLYMNHHKMGIFSGIALGSLFTFVFIGKLLTVQNSMLSLEFSLVWLASGIGLALVLFLAGKNLKNKLAIL